MLNRFQILPLTLQFTMSLTNNKDLLAITNKKGKNNNFFIEPHTVYGMIKLSPIQIIGLYLQVELKVIEIINITF